MRRGSNSPIVTRSASAQYGACCLRRRLLPPDGNTNGSANGNNPSWLFPDLLLGPDRHSMQKRHTSLPAGVERRAFPIELRAEDADAPGLIGYAARYNVLSGNLGGFRERILPGAFADAVLTSDIRALWNHEDSLVLGRTKSGTLRVADTELGLHVEIDLPDTTAGRDALTSIRRGDVDQMSFAFTVGPDGDRWFEDEDGRVIREIRSVKELFDVSPVTYPAYDATTVSARSIAEARMATASTDAERAALRKMLDGGRPKGRPVSYFQKRLDLASL